VDPRPNLGDMHAATTKNHRVAWLHAFCHADATLALFVDCTAWLSGCDSGPSILGLRSIACSC